MANSKQNTNSPRKGKIIDLASKRQVKKCCDGEDLCDKCRAELEELHAAIMKKVDQVIEEGERHK